MSTYKQVPQEGYGSYDWLRREVGGYLGMGYNPSVWNAEQAAKVDGIVQSGVMQFYYHPPMRDDKGNIQMHRWSFLTPVAELEIKNGVRDYELPEDFSGIEGGFTVGE